MTQHTCDARTPENLATFAAIRKQEPGITWAEVGWQDPECCGACREDFTEMLAAGAAVMSDETLFKVMAEIARRCSPVDALAADVYAAEARRRDDSR